MGLIKFFPGKPDQMYVTVLLLVFCGIQGMYYWQYNGLAFSGDSRAYIKYGELLAKGIWEDNFHKIYLGYLAFLALLFTTGTGLKGVVLVQVALSGAAVYYLYSTIKIISRNYFTAFIGALLFISWPMLLAWNVFILSDAVFISFLVFSLYRVVKSADSKQYFLTVVCLVITVLIRPNGFIVLTGYLFYLTSHQFRQLTSIKHRVFLLSLAGLGSVVFILLINHYLLANFNFLKTYPSGRVIFNSQYFVIKGNQITNPPADLSRLHQLVYFILNNPAFFTKMALVKCLLFFSNVKPYYSWLHNLFIVCVLYPCYYLGVKSLANSSWSWPLKCYLASVVVQQAFIVTLTSEDWDGRFLTSIISYIFVLAALGLQEVLEKKWPVFFKDAAL